MNVEEARQERGRRKEERGQLKRRREGEKTRRVYTDLTVSGMKDQRGIRNCSTPSSSCDF